jgi:hypothetical protein
MSSLRLRNTTAMVSGMAKYEAAIARSDTIKNQKRPVLDVQSCIKSSSISSLNGPYKAGKHRGAGLYTTMTASIG